MSIDTLQITPTITTVHDLARRCIAAGGMGAVIGPNGTGKTKALLSLLEASNLGLNGNVHYFLSCYAEGHARAVRNLLIDLEVRQATVQRGTSMQVALKLALREFQERKISLLLVDEADLLKADALQGLITLYDFCNQKGHPLTMIVAGVKPAKLWLHEISAATSRTLHILEIPLMSRELVCAVLEAWGGKFQDLAEKAKRGEAEALATLDLIHSGTKQTFRKLYYFGKLANLDESPIAFSFAEKVLGQMKT